MAGFIGLSLLVGVTAAGFTASSVHGWFRTLARPPGTPPNWVFGPVWTMLYLLMGIAAWLVWRGRDLAPHRSYRALRLWGWQLLLNAAWTPAFFGLHSTAAGLSVILALLLLILLTLRAFVTVERVAAALMLPYAAWAGYAAYLTAGFWWLN